MFGIDRGLKIEMDNLTNKNLWQLNKTSIQIEQTSASIPQFSVENWVDVFSYSLVGFSKFSYSSEAMEECDFLPIIFDIIVGILFPSKFMNFYFEIVQAL